MRASNPSWSRNVEIQPLHECEAESGLKHHDSGSIVCLVPKGNVFIWNNPAPVSAGGGPRLTKQACGQGGGGVSGSSLGYEGGGAPSAKVYIRGSLPQAPCRE
jgi:hypothetical protein